MVGLILTATKPLLTTRNKEPTTNRLGFVCCTAVHTFQFVEVRLMEQTGIPARVNGGMTGNSTSNVNCVVLT